jgi:hypothetical protein
VELYSDCSQSPEGFVSSKVVARNSGLRQHTWRRRWIGQQNFISLRSKTLGTFPETNKSLMYTSYQPCTRHNQKSEYPIKSKVDLLRDCTSTPLPKSTSQSTPHLLTFAHTPTRQGEGEHGQKSLHHDQGKISTHHRGRPRST